MVNNQSASMVVNDQFTFFSLPSNQNGPAYERETTKALKKKPITKITLTLGLIELLTSTILFGGFIEPLESSQMYIVWSFTLFSIILCFSGLLSITSCWCGNISAYFVIIRLIWSMITIGIVCLQYYTASIIANKAEWKNHLILFFGITSIEGLTSLTSLVLLIQFQINTCKLPSRKTEIHPFMDLGTNETDIPLAININDDRDSFEPSYPLGGSSSNDTSSFLVAPGTPPPTYNDVRSSLIYERTTRNP